MTVADCSMCRSAHEKPFPKWYGFNDHCWELRRMSELLQALREKRFELPQLTPFLPDWYWVPTFKWVPRQDSCFRY